MLSRTLLVNLWLDSWVAGDEAGELRGGYCPNHGDPGWLCGCQELSCSALSQGFRSL